MPPQGRITEIEALRGIAILMVLVEHMPLDLFFWNSALMRFEHTYWRGAAGVDLFFAISGFVIARSLVPALAEARHAERVWPVLRSFWIRRIFRLWPAGWVWLALPLLPAALTNASGAFGHWHADLVAALMGWLNILNIHIGLYWRGGDVGMASPYWSLSLEEQFYLVLPLSALLLGRWLPWAMAGLVAYQFELPMTVLANMTRPGALAAGVLAAETGAGGRTAATIRRMLGRRRWLGPTLLALGLAGIGACFNDSMIGAATSRLRYDVGMGVLSLLTAALVAIAGWDGGFLLPESAVRRLLAWVGARSYTLYLTHRTAYAGAREILFRVSGNDHPGTALGACVLLAIAMPILLLLTEATYRLVEQPCRAYGAGLAARLSRSPSAADATALHPARANSAR